MAWLDNKEILITGGTGTLGKKLTELLIKNHKPKGIRIFSRDELKQWEMQKTLDSNVPVSFLIGDIRNYPRIKRASEGVDLIIHTAAMKQVPACEDNPLEAIQTNVHGAENVLNAALDSGVQRVMNVSTDKAVYPINLYGATKLAAEKLFIHGNVYSGSKGTIFSCCRYGNVLGSRGSVYQVFKEQAINDGPIRITDDEMTRFWISIGDVAQFLLERCCDMNGGEVFIPKMPSMKIIDMAQVLYNRYCKPTPRIKSFQNKVMTTGIRKGEKLHECLITNEELPYTVPSGVFKIGDTELTTTYFIIKNDVVKKSNILKQSYTSDSNDVWLEGNELLKMAGEQGI